LAKKHLSIFGTAYTLTKLLLRGRVPSKKNSRINTRSGRSFPSAKYTEWHKDASKQVLGAPKLTQKGITMSFWLPDNRRTDLNNKAASILDMLVDNGILEDDSWQIIGEERYIPMGVDKDDPRVEIEYA